MTEYMKLETRVYHITKDKSSYNIHAYIEYNGSKKEYKFYTFYTEKKIPEIISKKYEKIKEKGKYYYPMAFIIPNPKKRTNKQTIPFDGKFFLVIAYAKEIPLYIPSDKLISVSKMNIYEENKKLKMNVEGICGLAALKALKNNNKLNKLELRSYTIDLSRANLDDLLNFLRYDSKNNQSNKEGEMEKALSYIFISGNKNLSCKQSNIAPKDIKILEIYRTKR